MALTVLWSLEIVAFKSPSHQIQYRPLYRSVLLTSCTWKPAHRPVVGKRGDGPLVGNTHNCRVFCNQLLIVLISSLPPFWVASERDLTYHC
jgi:hypothetical protein